MTYLHMTSTLTTTDAAASPRPIQVGPVFHCFTCGAKARGLIAWRPCGSPLDAWAAHIAYLNTPCACSKRVARLGDAVTPLALVGEADFPTFGERVAANLAAVAEAVRDIAASLPPEARSVEPAERLVRELLAGLLAPDEAVRRIRALAAVSA